MTRWLPGLSLALFLLFSAFSASAAEAITSFDQVVTLNHDGSMQVTETIAVNAEGNAIRRGIFRDFPLTFRDTAGHTTYVDFAVVAVERDGQPEEWHSEQIDRGERIYIGRQDQVLSHGPHVFRVTYNTNRQFRYFDDHDELYWNVTGNGWQFPIWRASATVLLPDGAAPQQLGYFTGPIGATGKDAKASQMPGKAVFATTRPLAAGDGLTIALSFPKGAIAPPSAAQMWTWFIKDNMDLMIAAGGFIILFVYYLWSWVSVGRDPPRGVMVPRWDPPQGISPALVNYIDNRGFSNGCWTALSATAIDLAVRGYLTLDDLKNGIILRATGRTPAEKLESGEKAIFSGLGPFTPIVIDKANGENVEKLGQQFRNAIEREHRGEFYRANSAYVAGGVALSIVILVAIVLYGRLHENVLPMIAVPAFLSIVVTGIAVKIGRASSRRGSSLLARFISILFFAFFGIVAITIAAGALAAAMVPAADAVPLLAAIVGIFALNVVFFFLMGAPTPLGRKMMDGIDGLRQYLTLAERDRMNMQGAPTMSPQHFETLLPYAVALGVEKPWSRAFDTWLAAAAAGAAAASVYAPSWYSGDYSSGRWSDGIGGFSSSMASTITSTIPQPVSSSSSAFSGGSSSGGGGGGGFSGGGGGGGGGGGW
ncbi:MAG: DUF2207 domain-containing protein [Rhizobiaceae bacterium]|nr:DUF2207 domain-containing protein [Rhizobiaceae bacterium]